MQWVIRLGNDQTLVPLETNRQVNLHFSCRLFIVTGPEENTMKQLNKISKPFFCSNLVYRKKPLTSSRKRLLDFWSCFRLWACLWSEEISFSNIQVFELIWILSSHALPLVRSVAETLCLKPMKCLKEHLTLVWPQKKKENDLAFNFTIAVAPIAITLREGNCHNVWKNENLFHYYWSMIFS